jgi:DNA polymerase-3 subunit beta
MQLLVNREAFADGINRLLPIIKTRTPKPALTCVRITAANRMLRLAATDMEIALTWHLSAVDIQQEGECLIPCERLASVLKGIASETVRLDSDAEWLLITSDSGRFKIMGYRVSEHPTIEPLKPADSDCIIDAGILASLFEHVRFAAAEEPTRYALNGILLAASGKRLEAVATDSHRLALAREDLAAEAKFSCVLPNRAVDILGGLCDDGGRIRIQFEKTFRITVAIMLGDSSDPIAVMRCALVEGTFPPYDDVVPKTLDKKAVANRERLMATVSQSSVFQTEESKGVRFTFAGSGVLTVHGRGAEIGEATVDMPVDYSSEQLEIAFNPTYVKEFLAVNDCENVTLELQSPNKGMIIRGDPGAMYLVMPVNLS